MIEDVDEAGESDREDVEAGYARMGCTGEVAVDEFDVDDDDSVTEEEKEGRGAWITVEGGLDETEQVVMGEK